MLPPIVHTCCGTPCFQEYEGSQNAEYACWGNIYCIDTELVELEDGSCDEYRYGACQGHEDIYRNYDRNNYRKPK